MDIQSRFEAKIDVDYDGCWLWNACISAEGYGRFGVDGRIWFAHRYAYELYNGPIPIGLEVDHLCRIKNCVNPAHLEAVTHRENVLRGDSPIISGQYNKVKTHCKNGHSYSGSNLKFYRNGHGSFARICRSCKNASAVRSYHKKKKEVSHF